MILGYVQRIIADTIGIERPKDIGFDFSFTSNSKLNEEEFLNILEQLEEEMDMNLVDYAWKFNKC